MRKIILVQWDMQLGPRTLVQFPPEADFPPKELLLKIWARHEMHPDSNFISFIDDSSKLLYCSTLYRDKSTNEAFFFMLEAAKNLDDQMYHEIMGSVVEELLNNYDTPHFSHILSETFRTIKLHSDLKEDELLFRLFEDKTRLTILKILREGVTTKHGLRARLISEYYYKNINIDLLLSPFRRLKLIEIHDMPGAEGSIFLLQDVFACRIPPRKMPNDEGIRQKIYSMFSSRQIIDDIALDIHLSMLREPDVSSLIKEIEEANEGGLHETNALLILDQKEQVLQSLLAERYLYVNDAHRFFVISTFRFLRICPTYIIPILAERYNRALISMEQFIFHTDLLLDLAVR